MPGKRTAHGRLASSSGIGGFDLGFDVCRDDVLTALVCLKQDEAARED